MKRNLLFHLYPKKESIWRWHTERLLEYRHAWNGRRLVTVVLDGETESKQTVLEALDGLNAEIAFERNDPTLGETRLFVERLGQLRSEDPDEATFYAHAKGVTRTKQLLEASLSWSRAMYILNLGSVPAVERALRRSAAVGCFRHRIIVKEEWRSCYAGTFFWLKHADLFTRDWRRIDQTLYGVEFYPGLHFRWEELGVWTPDNLSPQWLYGGGVTGKLVQEWKRYWEDDMHSSVIDFLRKEIKGSEILGKTVLEVGSYNVNGTPRSVLEPLAPATYIGVDSQLGPCVDRAVSVDDLVKEFGEERFDVVLSTEMLEHVRYWRRAVTQMKAVTKLGGLLVITTRSPGFPYHAYPDDHWRFTLDHFREIFSDMEILVLESDVPNMPGVLLKARRKPGPLLTVEELKSVNPGNAR